MLEGIFFYLFHHLPSREALKASAPSALFFSGNSFVCLQQLNQSLKMNGMMMIS